MAAYPGTIKTFLSKTNVIDSVQASHVNELQGEVSAIETALGANVNIDADGVNRGSVRQRLNTLQTDKVSESDHNNSLHSAISHNALADLASGNPHTQYVNHNLATSRGQVLVGGLGGASGFKTLNRGAAGTYLTPNGSGDLQWSPLPQPDGGARVILSQNPNTLVYGTTGWQNLLYFVMPAGSLEHGDHLRITLAGDYFEGTTQYNDRNLRVLINGSQTLAMAAIGNRWAVTTGRTGWWTADFDLYALTQGGVSNIRGQLVASNLESGASWEGSASNYRSYNSNTYTGLSSTPALDLTGNITFHLQIYGNYNTNNSWTRTRSFSAITNRA